MATLTLDVPPSVANHWNTLSEEERLRRAAAFVETIEEEAWAENDRREARAAIVEALAEVESGQDISYEEFLNKRSAFWEARKRKARE